jgi:predicted AAA+ superfamily ATPase
MYPDTLQTTSLDEKIGIVKHLAADYLYKDVLKFQKLKNSDTVTKLLQALAFQIGHEVSYLELSRLVGVSQQLVSEYIEILEKVFVLFRLPPLARNLRKEIARSRKIYFYDLGIRNAHINNFNPLALRNDVGGLWENFCIAEKMKQQLGLAYKSNFYFWRTYDQQEIDLVEEKGGKFFAYEMKWEPRKAKIPVAWKNTYPDAEWKIVDRGNYLDFLK